MAKLLKIAAVGVGLAAAVASGGLGLVAGGAILGLSSASLTLIAAGLSVGASLLAPKPKAPINSQENINRLRASIDPKAYRKTVVGTPAYPVDIR